MHDKNQKRDNHFSDSYFLKMLPKNAKWKKESEEWKMFIILFILIIGIPILKESFDDAQYRDECRRRGQKTYWSHTGERYTSNNEKVNK